MKKRLAVGNSSFDMIRRQGYYYIDKTCFIKPLMESGNFVELITRPRRFGKTLFMDTLRAFLSVNPSAPDDISFQTELFQGLDVSGDKAFCEKYMGKIPVLYFSFKGIEGVNFEQAYRVLARKIAESVQVHAYLLSSNQLNEYDKMILQNMASQPFMRQLEHQDSAASFFSSMAGFIAKHFNRPIVLLIDEYDVPLAKAAANGYYKEMCLLIRGMLEVLKPEFGRLISGMPVLEKAVLTGCLRVSKESIFTGVNNFAVNTVCMDNKTFASCMGFTETEVNTLLTYYGLEDRKADVKRWYDGYRIGLEEIYCPWDVINFCKYALNSQDARAYEPKNYWSGTSGSEAIDEFLGFLSEADADRMQLLLDGEEAELKINEQLTYDDFRSHRSEDFWTLLLFAGYLTVSKDLGGNRFLLRIPNEEIRQTFRERVQMRFSYENNTFAQHGLKLADAALSGDADGMADVLEPLLRSYVSVRDAASRAPAENYYHGFLSALFACAGSRIQDFASNAEAGDGYADIVFSSGTGSRRTGVVIEIKRAQRAEDLRRCAADAMEQIESRQYALLFDKMRCRRYYAYGLAFCGKHCEVKGGVLKTLS